jgi:octaprenyl-diphosphate synthase
VRAAEYAQKAIDALAVFPAGPMRAAMEEAALFAVSRRY